MDAPSPSPAFEIMVEKPVPGLFRRFLTTLRHLLGLLFGGLAKYVKTNPQAKPFVGFFVVRFTLFFARPFVDRDLRDLPFPVQLRRRLEILGPTYIKLGQVLSLREDILPKSVTSELLNLLNRLPIVPYKRYCELVSRGLGRPANEVFLWIEPTPVGSASIAQTHRATTMRGDRVILKVVKPGIKKILQRDAKLISLLGSVLQPFLQQYQPKQVLSEFTEYTLREVDLRLEADNAETFTANFLEDEHVIFPKIYREYSSETVLCMEFLEGLRPDDPGNSDLTDQERTHLIDTGAGAIIRMLYRDGFFHADLHPGNLLILDRKRCGFIDLGMVGRFDEALRRTMMYYYYCLVIGDAENAARYLCSVAAIHRHSRPDAFRRAVADISRRWQRSATFDDFSLGQLIMESVSMGGKYHMYFPMDLVLMIKALVTFEGVGQILKPGVDVAELSRSHISKIFMSQFNPIGLVKESLRGAPDLVEAIIKAPSLVTQGIKYFEKSVQQEQENPLSGIRGSVMAGFSLLSGSLILAVRPEAWYLSAPFFVVSLFLALRTK